MDPNCLVTIPHGKILGIKSVSVFSDKKYYQFLGIPYAEPPTGLRRFLPPKPAKRWSGTLDATKEKDGCIQFSVFAGRQLGSEDCLYLNVNTPEAPRNIETPKPVLVLIHPGGHFWGSSSRDSLGNPDFIIHHDIIFVTFNYRLHILGFLNLDIQHCRGNMGLKDQSMALKWVKDNISYFGGDPDNITLIGSSSGACDIHMHMMSPMSKDLFKRGILQCGYALNSYWSYQVNHIERAFELAKVMGFKGKSRVELLQFLKKQDAVVLFEAHEKLKKLVISKNVSKSELCLFQPTIEAFEEGAFMCKSPRELIKTAIPKPLICSVSATEGLVAFWANPIKLIRNGLSKVVKENLWIYNIDGDMLENICEKIRSFYFNDKPVDHTMVENITNLYTDMWFCEWQDWLDSISSNPSETPVYVYYFSHCGRLCYQQRHFATFLPKESPQITAASHGDDASYILLYHVRENQGYQLKLTPDDEKIVNYTTRFITNFAKNGDPNDERLNGIHWVPHNAENPSYLHINDDVEIVQGRVFGERAAFWHHLVEQIKDHENELNKIESSR